MPLYFSLVTMSVCIKYLLDLTKAHQTLDLTNTRGVPIIDTPSSNLGSLTSN